MLSKTNKDILINKREVYRYLGYGHNLPTEEMIELIDSCIQDVIKNSELRYVTERLPVQTSDNEGEFFIGDTKVISKDLAKNLRDCREVYLMGATIGVGVDRLIARAAVADVSKAAIYQAIGAAYIEDYCDYINVEIDAIACSENLDTRPRFSPGYGDLSLDYQNDIARILNLPKNVGISLSESKIMSPSKSVTAIIGLRKKPDVEPEEKISKDNPTSISKCRFCDKVDCQFREG